MEAVNANDSSLSAERTKTPRERIATLEERSQHAATKAELHRSLLWLYIALFTTISGLLGGLMPFAQYDARRAFGNPTTPD